mgnify:CR=1 FL=1
MRVTSGLHRAGVSQLGWCAATLPVLPPSNAVVVIVCRSAPVAAAFPTERRYFILKIFYHSVLHAGLNRSFSPTTADGAEQRQVQGGGDSGEDPDGRQAHCGAQDGGGRAQERRGRRRRGPTRVRVTAVVSLVVRQHGQRRLHHNTTVCCLLASQSQCCRCCVGTSEIGP